MTGSYDVIVIGGGVLGAAVGYHLTNAGLRAVIVDRADHGHATRAGAGIVCPVTATVGDDRLVSLAFEAAAYYPVLAQELSEHAVPTGYRGSSMLSVSVDGLGVEQVSRTAAWADRIATRTEYAELCGYRILTESDCRAICPVLGGALDGGLLIPAAQVDGHEFRQSLLAAAQRDGLTVLPGDVERLRIESGGVTSVMADGMTLTADHVVLSAGAWTERLLPLGAAAPIITAARGEILHLQVDGMDTGGWPLVEVEATGPYLVPWPSGRLAVGTTFERADDFDARATLAGVRQIAEALERATAGRLAGAKLLDCRVGLRPVSADGLPLVGRWPGAERVVLATGHGANGLSWGPYTGKLVAELITGQPSDIDLGLFAADRFAGVGWKEHR
jgi:D-amino-acid dehydrogenase